MLSGGSTESTSLMLAATTVTEQIVPSGRLPVGSSVIDEPGEPLTVKLSGVPAGQSSVNELVGAVTGSLKLTTTFVFTATWSAASAGDVVVTVGPVSCVANEKLVFAAGWSGGSPLSTSLMLAATAVTVQCAVGRSLSGSSVIPDVPEPLTWKVCGLPSHTIVNELESTVTGSLKVKEYLAARFSGGSMGSTSVISLASTVTVQEVAPGRSAVGSIVIVEVPEPLTEKAWALPLGHSSVNELALAFTGSLKVTVMFPLAFTPVAEFAGLVLETVGALSVVNEKE